MLGELIEPSEQPLRDIANGALGKRFFDPPDGARPMLSIDNEKPVDTDRSDACQDLCGAWERLVGLGTVDARLDELREAERRSGRSEVIRLPNDLEQLPELALRRCFIVPIEPRCQIAPERRNDIGADPLDLGTPGGSVQDECRRGRFIRLQARMNADLRRKRT